MTKDGQDELFEVKDKQKVRPLHTSCGDLLSLPSSDLGDELTSVSSTSNEVDPIPHYDHPTSPVNFLRKNIMRASALSIQSQW